MKKPFKIILKIALVVLLLVVVYAAYFVIKASRRLPDKLPLRVENQQTEILQKGGSYEIITYNIGFGAYEQDYGFFMDGGTESRAYSRARLEKNFANIIQLLKDKNSDIMLIQEVDRKASRTYRYQEEKALAGAFPGYNYVFAQNWDSPYILYPLKKPMGKANTGIMTLSRFKEESAIRRSLPKEKNIMSLADLDRCYSVTYLPVDNKKYLVMFNVHPSAYTNDPAITTAQIKMLIEDMAKVYESGNYVICGGDFNRDLTGHSSEIFKTIGHYNWAEPFPEELLHGTDLKLHHPVKPNKSIPTCRNADGPYNSGQFVTALDGFITSPNVLIEDINVVDTEFMYSDHNPVEMRVTLI